MVNNNIIIQQLMHYGINNCCEIIYNPSFEQLFLEETNENLTSFERGTITSSGAIAVNTGIFTGRSPLDKYLVSDENTHNQIWWSNQDNASNNHPISQTTWKYLKELVGKQLSYKRLFILDVYCGAKINSRLQVRFVTEVAWQAHFVKNMFIQPNQLDLISFKPDFIVLNGAKCINPNWREQGMHSENFIALNLTENMQLIGGTWYGGEMKKGLFTVMNYQLPLKNIASMHCSANVGQHKDVALFFGLSGTGKTTLSHDSNRSLIGDDEHGWDDDGIFNLEGGCYAKTINLNPELEPEIFQAIKRNALLENVMVRADGSVNYNDNYKTDNARVSYPINHIKNRVQPTSCANHASIVIFLTADAFGVLPPVAYLTNDQAQYYFLSGFSAKLSGTERDIIAPIPTFSACFGAAFLSLHPTMYADILAKKMKMAGTNAYLVNTGWNGSGNRIALKHTKVIINAILNQQIQDTPTITLPIFNLKIPRMLIGIDSDILDPRNSYIKRAEWQNKASDLAKLFIENFNKLTQKLAWLRDAGPKL